MKIEADRGALPRLRDSSGRDPGSVLTKVTIVMRTHLFVLDVILISSNHKNAGGDPPVGLASEAALHGFAHSHYLPTIHPAFAKG